MISCRLFVCDHKITDFFTTFFQFLLKNDAFSLFCKIFCKKIHTFLKIFNIFATIHAVMNRLVSTNTFQ